MSNNFFIRLFKNYITNENINLTVMDKLCMYNRAINIRIWYFLQGHLSYIWYFLQGHLSYISNNWGRVSTFNNL